MKRILLFILACCLICTISACSDSEDDTALSDPQDGAAEDTQSSPQAPDDGTRPDPYVGEDTPEPDSHEDEPIEVEIPSDQMLPGPAPELTPDESEPEQSDPASSEPSEPVASASEAESSREESPPPESSRPEPSQSEAPIGDAPIDDGPADNTTTPADPDNFSGQDFFIHEGAMCVNAAGVDWVMAEDLTKGYEAGEILRSGVTDNFRDGDATVLRAGTKLYQHPDRVEIIMAVQDGVTIPYLKLVDG